MIVPSTTMNLGYTVPTASAGVSYSLTLKSKFTGDIAPVRSFQFRAISRAASVGDLVLSSGGAHDFGSNDLTMVPRKRPALMHQHGVLVTSGTSGVPFQKPTLAGEVQREVGSVAILIKPVSGTVRITRGALTLDITSAGVVTYTGAQTLYVNGASVTTGSTIAFPYPRLLLIAYTAIDTNPVTIGSSTGTATFYLQSASVSQRILTGTDAATHARLLYRKPSTVTVLTDSAISSVPSDSPVTVPEVWLEF
jgi:hypothetical protein